MAGKRRPVRTGRQGDPEVRAAELAGPQGHQPLAKQDRLLAEQADRAEGAVEVVVVHVRRDAVLLTAGILQRAASAQL